jgi:excisionase family DNA binding protein
MPEPMSARIPVLEIAQRLHVGKRAVYAMLERRQMPGLRVGRKWI